MKICVIGTGYVGLVAGTCLADMGNSVICIDNNEEKIKKLEKGIVPIYEPGLEELIKINVKENRLSFSTDLSSAVKTSKVCFIAVATPQDTDGSCNLSSVIEVAKEIAKNLNEYKVIVNKSTVPVGTAEKLTAIIKDITDVEFDVVSNPEFLKQGAAVDDFLSPDRVIIGSNSEKASQIMKDIYSPYFKTADRTIFMDVKSAEMTKYVANAFLATKISFINEMANICEKVGADIEKVRIGISTDNRIGNKFLFPGIGFGGSCFPKDVSALISVAKENNTGSDMLQATRNININQKKLFVEKILNFYNGDIKGKTFAVWGLSFKPKTNDMREAPSIDIINSLLKHGAKIQAYDPQAGENAYSIFKDTIEYAKSAYDALENSNAIILLTEWNEFRRPDFEKIKSMVADNVIFDGRNQYNPEKIKSLGIKYINIGSSLN
ncbi:MAG: UDP-glucose/GDP-mannose dehydrogenase family protein [Candidatus Gastranaerophilales bacterium]|nr:UDP-glucose/GDP-mannose dehydrogenase family protein [Candidatus Gastranaerophilales bacterium]